MSERIRGRPWERIRRRVLFDQPLCRRCEAKGKIREAVQVDHEVPLSKGGTDDDDNLQGLCVECHKEKTLEDMGQKQKRKFGPDGFPIA